MEADPEMLPFNDQENPKVDGFVQQRTYSSTLSSSSSSHSSINMTAVANTPYLSTKLPRELLSCIIFCLFGMYAPSKLIYPIFGSNIRPIPYQILPNSNDVILDPSLNNPLVENVTIPSNFLIQTVITLPVFILICITYIFAPILKPKYHDTHSAVCALFTTVGMSEFTTQILKLYVGRLRPNFYALCGFDVQLLSCTNPEKMVMEGRWSFPSGHSSLSFAGMTVLTLFLLGRVGIGGSNVDISSSNNNNNNNKSCNNNNRNRWYTKPKLFSKAKTILALLPLSYSTLCATSRLVDNWHHPSDVIAGTCLGLFFGLVGYHLWYPSIVSHKYAGVPVSYLNALIDLKEDH